jgi:16S rRNA (guanine527-N7)-methyltransferase
VTQPEPEPTEAIWERFAAAAERWHVSLAPRQLDAFHHYLRELAAWNRRFNLTRITAPEEILVKHFLDSLSCTLAADFHDGGRLIDVGSGAGFPGLPLKIAFPALRVTLLDSLQKRLNFLERLTSQLGITDVELVHVRAEEAGQDPRYRERFDWAVARAVARLDLLVGWLLPLARPGGCAIAMKGPDVTAELATAGPAIAALGGGLPEVTSFELPLIQVGRSLIRIPKERPTPPRYPRSMGGRRRARRGSSSGPR